MAPTEPIISGVADRGRIARRRSAGARGRLEPGRRRLGDFSRARHRLYRARGARAWSQPRRSCPTASSPGSAWCWSRASNGATGSARGFSKRCIDDVARAGPRARARCHAGRAARSIARSASQETWGYHRLARQCGAGMPRRTQPRPATSIVRPIGDADWPALCAMDAAAFGADRGALLPRLRGRLPAAELIAERHGRIAGFLLGRNGRSASQIGPLVAEDDDAAHALAGARARRPRPVRSMSISPTARPAFGHGSRNTVLPRSGRSPACCSAARQASTTRRAPSRWPDRSSAERKRPAAIATGPVQSLKSAQ